MNLHRRLRAFEQRVIGDQVVLNMPCGRVETLQRTLNPGAGLTELVKLDGDENGFSDEQLEASIASFPVEVAGNARGR